MSANDYEFPTEKQRLGGLRHINKIRGELKRIKAKRDRHQINTREKIRIKANQLQARAL
ncbi:hypothetical protein [Photobacterium proteolyticum]|uniref:hypothetical protein n=1 Tax=Photobacterium proteolyticum TaxID=1903952 RepID=UPI000ACDE8CA|nr:hypothetical protein [Photobacterium proteolyticum]